MKVYVVQCQITGRVKIGLSQNPEKRLHGLQVGAPTELVLLGSVPGGADLEERLHALCHACRIRGEWFSPTAEVRDALADVGIEIPPDEERDDAVEAAVAAEMKRVGSHLVHEQRRQIREELRDRVRAEVWVHAERIWNGNLERMGEFVVAVARARGYFPPRRFEHGGGPFGNGDSPFGISGSMQQWMKRLTDDAEDAGQHGWIRKEKVEWATS